MSSQQRSSDAITIASMSYSKNIQEIENDINNLSTITNWTDKVNAIKNIKLRINEEVKQLDDLYNMIINDQLDVIGQKKKKSTDLNSLIEQFDEMENLEDKLTCYNKIIVTINRIQNELFTTEELGN
jgi:glycogen synthase